MKAEVRRCGYCGTKYRVEMIVDWSSLRGTRMKPQRMTCSKPCQHRLRSWAAWEKKTTEAVVYGDVNKPIPSLPAYPGPGGLEAAIAPYGLPVEQLAMI